PLGYWAAYDCDWRSRRICVVGREYRVRVWNDCRIGRIPLHHYRSDHHHAGQWSVWHSRSLPPVSGNHRHTYAGSHDRRDYLNQRPSGVTSNPRSWNSTSGIVRPHESPSNTHAPTRTSRQPGNDHGRVSRDPQQNQTLPAASRARSERSMRGPQTPQPGDANFVGPVTSQDRQRVQSNTSSRRVGVPAAPPSSRSTFSERPAPPVRTESQPSFRRESNSPPAQARVYSGRSTTIDRPTVQHVE
nr:hypothetical protein [Opitutaceae bacterium]